MSTDVDLELVVLEDILNVPHCEIKHTNYPIPCLHTAVARRTFKCQEKTYLLCLNAVRTTYEKLHPSWRGICTVCKQPTNSCWNVVPL